MPTRIIPLRKTVALLILVVSLLAGDTIGQNDLGQSDSGQSDSGQDASGRDLGQRTDDGRSAGAEAAEPGKPKLGGKSKSGRQTKLVRMLIGRSERVRLRAIADVENNSSGKLQLLPELISAARTLAERARDETEIRTSFVRLLYVIGSIDDPDAEKLLVEMLDSENMSVSMICADSLGRNKFYGAIGQLKEQTRRPEYLSNYGFRFNLIRALAVMEHPDAVEIMSELRVRLDGQLRHEIEKILDNVTLSHFLGDEERFAAWKETRESEGIFKTVGFEPESLSRIRYGRPQKYYGINIYAKRVMFIIDRSGSMVEKRYGVTRMERAKAELVRAIEELPEDAWFAIVTFQTNVYPWQNELIEANEENKKKAIDYVKRLSVANGSWTNTHRALRESLDFDDELEAVFMLTDGQPTTGKIVAPGAIVNDILSRNLFRNLNFNTIGIGLNDATEGFLRTLSNESGGEFRKAF